MKRYIYIFFLVGVVIEESRAFGLAAKLRKPRRCYAQKPENQPVSCCTLDRSTCSKKELCEIPVHERPYESTFCQGSYDVFDYEYYLYDWHYPYYRRYYGYWGSSIGFTWYGCPNGFGGYGW